MKFIRSEWDKKHILALNRKFFLYEYGNNSLVNFVISKINNKINGIQGFLKSSSSKKATLWATMWCTSKKCSTNVRNFNAKLYEKFKIQISYVQWHKRK